MHVILYEIYRVRQLLIFKACYILILEINAKNSSIDPKFQAAFVGSEVSIKCYSHSKPIWHVSFGNKNIVIKKNISIILRKKFYIYELFFSNAKTRHTGKYTCQGTKKNGLRFEEISSLHVGGEIIEVLH